MPKPEQEQEQEQKKPDYTGLILKKAHTHNRVRYPAGTKLSVFEPDKAAIDFMKQVKAL